MRWFGRIVLTSTVGMWVPAVVFGQESEPGRAQYRSITDTGEVASPRPRLEFLQREIRRFDFEEIARQPHRFPLHFYRIGGRLNESSLVRPGFPLFGVMGFSNEASVSGDWSFRFDLAGGSMAASTAPHVIPIMPGETYRVSASIRTRNLTVAAARLAAHFLDSRGDPVEGSHVNSNLIRTGGRWEEVEIEIADSAHEAAELIIELQLLQRAAACRGGSARNDEDRVDTTRLAADPFRPVLEDVSGSAWFDDVTVRHVARIDLSTDHPGNMITAPDRVMLRLDVRHPTEERFGASITIRDIDGKVVHEESIPIPRGRSSHTITPQGLPFGWYRAVLELQSEPPRVAAVQPGMTRTALTQRGSLDFVYLPQSSQRAAACRGGSARNDEDRVDTTRLASRSGIGAGSPQVEDSPRRATRRGETQQSEVPHIDQLTPDRPIILTLQENAQSAINRRERVIDLALQILHAHRAGEGTLFLDDPWPMTGPDQRNPAPDPSLPAFLHLKRTLAGREFAGEVAYKPGVQAWLFEDDAATDAVLVAWNDSPSSQNAFICERLGDGPVVVSDLFGNRKSVSILRDGHHISLSDEPVFIEAIDPLLVKFRQGLAITPGRAPSVAREHEHEVVVRNPWPVMISGTAAFAGPAEWRFSPGRVNFSIPPQGQVRLPFSLQFGRSQPAGSSPIEIVFDIATDREFEYRAAIPFQIDLDWLDVTTSWNANDAGADGAPGLTVTATISNTGDRARNVEAILLAPGYSRMSRPVLNLGPGETAIRTFHLTDGSRRLGGSTLLVSVAEIGTTARVNFPLHIETQSHTRETQRR